MPYSEVYRILILNDAGSPIGGLAEFYTADGDRLGELVVPASGVDVDPGTVDLADVYIISHPGYGEQRVTRQQFYDNNIFTLHRQIPWGPVAGIVVVYWLLTRVFKF